MLEGKKVSDGPAKVTMTLSYEDESGNIQTMTKELNLEVTEKQAEEDLAAIGIANTMMMSIYERTKEIGVMKVLGCSLGNIQEMFLLEAGFIGLLGGIAGNILSFLMSSVINLIVGNSGMLSVSSDSNISYIPWWLVLVSMGFAIVVGVLAGYFPSRRAMKLSPLAAIRNE